MASILRCPVDLVFDTVVRRLGALPLVDHPQTTSICWHVAIVDTLHFGSIGEGGSDIRSLVAEP